MNEARLERRFGILVDSFYRLKSRHVGAELKPGSFDEQDLRKFMANHEANFDEVKAALRFVFVYDSTQYWANDLVDLAAFARAYDTICDQLDGWFQTDRTPSAQAAGDRFKPHWSESTANHMLTEGDRWETVIAAETHAGEPERPSDDNRDLHATPQPAGGESGIEALRRARKEAGI